MLTDSYDRKIEYLRLSVTDLCNIRCRYCMPVNGVPHVAKERILSFAEITRLVRILSGLGIRRVRLTGGEPLARNNLPVLVGMLKQVKDIREVLLTTNGILLGQQAGALRQAGLEKVNVHLDTLQAEKYRYITHWGSVDAVLAGIRAAQRVGFDCIKLNVVMQKGVNDDEVEDLLRFATDNGLILRLIELMPIGPARFLMPRHYIPLEKIRDRLREKYTLLPLDKTFGAGPAVYYHVGELNAAIGFISPVSQPFCQSCNRIRISSDGRFQDCLAFDGGFSLRDLLRDPTWSDAMIAEEVCALIGGKRESHDGFCAKPSLRTPCMYGIGG